MDRKAEIMDRFGDLLDEETLELLARHEEVRFSKISEVNPGRVNVRGIITGLGDPERANEIYISDETGRIRVLVSREIYMKADIGKEIEIYNGFAKSGKKGIEIYVNKFSIVRISE